jgi:hypothetical protein
VTVFQHKKYSVENWPVPRVMTCGESSALESNKGGAKCQWHEVASTGFMQKLCHAKDAKSAKVKARAGS